jgi:Protein of unknown function (DUF3987)
VWIRFADHVEAMLGRDGELRPISGLANKLPEHAARLAGVLTLVRDIYAGEITAEEMAAGIVLAQSTTPQSRCGSTAARASRLS